jgi:tellurite resistance protein
MKGKRKPLEAWAVLNAHGAMVALSDHKPNALPSRLVRLTEPSSKADAVVRAAVRFANACSARKKDWRKRVDSIVTTKLELRRAVDRYLKERK